MIFILIKFLLILTTLILSGDENRRLEKCWNLWLWSIATLYNVYNTFVIFILENPTTIVSEKCVPSRVRQTGNENYQGLVARVGGCQQWIRVFSFPLGETSVELIQKSTVTFFILNCGYLSFSFFLASFLPSFLFCCNYLCQETGLALIGSKLGADWVALLRFCPVTLDSVKEFQKFLFFILCKHHFKCS